MYSKVKSNELGLNDVQTAKNSTLEVSKPILHCDREAFNRIGNEFRQFGQTFTGRLSPESQSKSI